MLREQEGWRSRAQTYLDDPSLLRSIVADGCDRARHAAQETMRDVREGDGARLHLMWLRRRAAPAPAAADERAPDRARRRRAADTAPRRRRPWVLRFAARVPPGSRFSTSPAVGPPCSPVRRAGLPRRRGRHRRRGRRDARRPCPASASCRPTSKAGRGRYGAGSSTPSSSPTTCTGAVCALARRWPRAAC